MKNSVKLNSVNSNSSIFVKSPVMGKLKMVQLLLLVIYATILYYVYQLEQISDPPCDCSKDWRRDFIKWYFILISIYVIATLLTGYTFRPKSIFTAILGILSLIQIYSLFTYVRNLKTETECKCATELDLYNVAKYYSWFQVGMLVLSLALVLFMVVVRFALFRK